MPSDVEAQEQAEESLIDLPRGYPRYSALLSSDNAFQNFRKFIRLRMRLLLVMQDNICQLEEKLDNIDRQETWLIFHACLRKDKNQQRLELLSELRPALKEYDALLEDTRRVVSLPNPDKRELYNLRGWLKATGRLDATETGYLNQEDDLGNLTGPSDRAFKITENMVEDGVMKASKLIGDRIPLLRYKSSSRLVGDKIFVLGPIMRNASRVIAVCLVTLIILLPTLALPRLTGAVERATASIIAAAMVLVTISFFTRARTIELVACGASYVAVIVALTSTENIAIELRTVSNRNVSI